MLLLYGEQAIAQIPKKTAIKPPVKQQEIVSEIKPSYYKEHDSSYYQSFERYITARFYFSQKYAGVELEKNASVSKFRYVPNTSLAAGFGITYQSVTVNLGYGFGFLNKDGEKGKTKSLDIQARVYGRTWTVDMLGQFYKSFYLTPKGLAAPPASAYYIRPDLRTQLMGVSAYRLLNPSRFSFRAALVGNEKQIKSAGSILIGAEIYYGIIKGDSSIVPVFLSDNYPQKDVRRLDFIKIGPGIGYAYTYVTKKNFYITGSLCASVSLDYSKQRGASGKPDNINLNKGFIYRVVAGHDKNNWHVNLSLVGNQMDIAGASTANKYLLSAGNFRLTVAKRITPGSGLTRRLHPVDKVIENVKGRKPGR